MLRDLQGVFHLESLVSGQQGEIDREQEKTCQPRYIHD